MSSSHLERPARARERLRLAAAIGALAALAITTGTLASLAVGTPVLADPDPPPADDPSASVLDWIPKFELSPRTEIEDELDQAQQALDRARAALDQARSEGTLPPEDLRALDRRLESYGPHAPELTDAPAPELPPRQYHHVLPEPPRSL